ncbi:Serine/threonine-protein phosphatase 4 regulatory subunit 3-like central domain-containing protein [Entamoeba marina]
MNTTLHFDTSDMQAFLSQSNLLPSFYASQELQLFVASNVYDICLQFLKGNRIAKTLILTDIIAISQALNEDPRIYNKFIDILENSDTDIRLRDAIGKILNKMIRFYSNRDILNIQLIVKHLQCLVQNIYVDSIAEYVVSLLTHDTYRDCETLKILCENKLISYLFEEYIKNTSPEVTRIIREIVLWKHSYNVGIVGEVFVDKCNTDPLLPDIYKSVFDNKLVDGIEMIGNLLTLSSSNEECCKIPSNGLPSLYRCLIPHYEKLYHLLEFEQSSQQHIIGQVKIQCVFLVLSLVVSNYCEVFKELEQHKIIPMVLDIFFDTKHQCTIIRQTIVDIVVFILQQTNSRLQEIIFDYGLLSKCISTDMYSVNFKIKHHMYPDIYGTNLFIMKTLYAQNDIDEFFIDYIEDHVIPRTSDDAVYLTDSIQTHEVTNDWSVELPVVDYFE